MAKKLFLLHTVSTLVKPFADLCHEVLPGRVELYHIVDEMLLKLAIAEGRLSPFIYRRAADHVIAADEAGADVVMFTCSSISPCVDAARPMVDVPVLKVDEPMVDKALSIGTTIGVAATLRSTLGPTTELVKTRAENLNLI